MNGMDQQPEFASVEDMWDHYRSLVDTQAIEVSARAVAELRADGCTVDAAMEQRIAQRVRQLLTDSLDEQQAKMNHQLLKGE